MGVLAAAWVVPSFIFYLSIYYLKPTYQLIYLPALVLLLGKGIERLAGSGNYRLGAITAIVAGAQACFFWAGDNRLPPQFYRLTNNFVVEQDAAWNELKRELSGYGPDTLVVFRAHPRLTSYSLRLMLHGRMFASFSPNGDLTVFDGGTWKNATPGDLDPYHRFLVITNTDGKCVVSPESKDAVLAAVKKP
jgi:hypothetical protein